MLMELLIWAEWVVTNLKSTPKYNPLSNYDSGFFYDFFEKFSKVIVQNEAFFLLKNANIENSSTQLMLIKVLTAIHQNTRCKIQMVVMKF
jgi:hypothetical protein